MQMIKKKYFMDIAKKVSELSKDEHTKVGAVIVDSDNRIVSTGYNGYVSGNDDTKIRYDRKPFSIEKNMAEVDKNDFMIHAELNAILFCDDKNRLKNSTIFITHYPCNNCSLAIAQIGIKNVIIGGGKSRNFGFNWYKSEFILKESNINVTILE